MQAKTEIIADLRKDGWHYTGACKVLISQDGMRLKIVFDDGRIFEGKPEGIAGICDACDEYAEDLIAVKQRGIAGLYSCRKCAGINDSAANHGKRKKK